MCVWLISVLCIQQLLWKELLSLYSSTLQDPLYGLLGDYLKLKEDAGSGKQVCTSEVLLNFKHNLWHQNICFGKAKL